MEEYSDTALRIPSLFVIDYILHNINSSSPIDFIVETTSQIFNYAFGNNFFFFGLGQIILLLCKPIGIAAALTVLILPRTELGLFYHHVIRMVGLTIAFSLSNWLLRSSSTYFEVDNVDGILISTSTSTLDGQHQFLHPPPTTLAKWIITVLILCSFLIFLATQYAILYYFRYPQSSNSSQTGTVGDGTKRPSFPDTTILPNPLGHVTNQNHLTRYALLVVVLPCFLSYYYLKFDPPDFTTWQLSYPYVRGPIPRLGGTESAVHTNYYYDYYRSLSIYYTSTLVLCTTYLTAFQLVPFLATNCRCYLTRFRMNMTAAGILSCLQTEWARLHLTYLLKVYWTFRVGIPAILAPIQSYYATNHQTGTILDSNAQDGVFRASDNGSFDAMYDKDLLLCNHKAFALTQILLRNILTRSCDTGVTLLASALTLSFLVDNADKFVEFWFLSSITTHNPNNPVNTVPGIIPSSADPSLGTASAILFLILAAQTGITGSTSPPNKLDRIGRNVILMGMALLHLVHDTILRPRLISLAASGVRSTSRHIKALSLLCVLFALATTSNVYYYLNHQLISSRGTAPSSSPPVVPGIDSSLATFSCRRRQNGGGGLFNMTPFPQHATLINTWLVSVLVLSAELTLKAIVCFITYVLHMVDFHRSTLVKMASIGIPAARPLPYLGQLLRLILCKEECEWDLRLDRALWYAGSIGGVVEFVFGLVLFFNALWILTFESRNGGAIRAAMTLLHAYFNLWLRAQRGMGSLLRRLRVDRRLARLTAKPLDVSLISLRPVGENSSESSDLTCPICRGPITYYDSNTIAYQGSLVFTDCGHPFHGPCLRKWLYSREDCPMCRTPVSPPASPSSNNQTPSTRYLTHS